MKDMTTLERKYFIIGKSEGFFKVKLDKIIDNEENVVNSYLQGYNEGEKKRSDYLTDEDNKEKWLENREGYIRTIGLKVGYENYSATDDNLNEDDKKIFSKGLKEGLFKRKEEQEVKPSVRVRK